MSSANGAVYDSEEQLVVEPFSKSRFTESIHDGVTVLVTEASALMDDNGHEMHLERLSAGSDEIGLAIEFGPSEVAVYSFSSIEYNAEFPNQIDKWEYVPTQQSLQRVPRCSNTKVVVYND